MISPHFCFLSETEFLADMIENSEISSLFFLGAFGLDPHSPSFQASDSLLRGGSCSSVQAWPGHRLPKWLQRSGSARCTRDSLRFGPNEFPAEREKYRVAFQRQGSQNFLESDTLWEASPRAWESPSRPRRERNPEARSRQALWITHWTSCTRHSARDEPRISYALVPDELSSVGEQRV